MPVEPLPTNTVLADTFDLFADLLEIGGERSRHRIQAYRRGAARVRGAGESVAKMALAGTAVSLPDIGGTLQDKIVEFSTTGTIGSLDRLRARVPEGLAQVAKVPGLGPKRAWTVWEHLQVSDLDGLRSAVEAGRLSTLDGIGDKIAAQVGDHLAALAAGDVPDARVPFGRAVRVAENLVVDLADTPGTAQLSVAGGLRRGAETVHDIDLAAGTSDPEGLLDVFTTHPMVTEVLSRGVAGAAVMTQSGIRAELRVGPVASFGNLLQHLSGSKAHNIRLRELAVKRGLSLSEHGVTDADGVVATDASEDGVYARLGLPWIPPELREDSGELEVAQAGLLPALVTEGDLRGDLHVHTTWSDGRDTLEAMVDAARGLGLEYVAISDHSHSLAMARGLDPDRVRRQWDAIDELNARLPDITVLKATEVDVLADGRLDFDDDLLAGFDWVTASLHSGFRQASARLTQRVLRAVEHPLVNAIGHPTGRMLDKREGYHLDLEEIFGRAAETGTVLEINAQPRRLDLNPEHARLALAHGVGLVIGTDAHSVDELAFRRFGVTVARRAGAVAGRIANTGTVEMLRTLRSGAHETR